MAMNLQDTLLAYSEWLDSEGLVVSDQTPDADTRSHDQLATDFIEYWSTERIPKGAAELPG